jgi:hypothetical protein
MWILGRVLVVYSDYVLELIERFEELTLLGIEYGVFSKNLP